MKKKFDGTKWVDYGIDLKDKRKNKIIELKKVRNLGFIA